MKRKIAEDAAAAWEKWAHDETFLSERLHWKAKAKLIEAIEAAIATATLKPAKAKAS